MKRLAFLAVLAGCAATYKDIHELKTNWYGRVTEVTGGSASASWQGPPWEGAPGSSWVTDLAGLLGSLSWLLVAGVVVVLVLLWKFPSLWRTLRERKAARAALRQP